MNTESVCVRRPVTLSPLPERRPRPPDRYSIDFSRQMTDLSITKNRLMEEERHSAELEDESKRLKALLESAIQKQSDTKTAYEEEQGRNSTRRNHLESLMVKMKEQEVELQECKIDLMVTQERLDGKQRDIDVMQEQLRHSRETITVLSNMTRLTTVYNGMVVSKLMDKEDYERVELETRLEMKAKCEQQEDKIKTLQGIVQSLQQENKDLRYTKTKFGDTIRRQEIDSKNNLKSVAMLEQESSSLKKSNKTLKEKNNDLESELSQEQQKLRDQKATLDLEIDTLQEENKSLATAYEKLKEQSSRELSIRDIRSQENVRAEKLRSIMQLRYKIFNEIQDLRGNIRVLCRVRPQKCQKTEASAIRLPSSDTGKTGTITCDKRSFGFNHVFHPYATNTDVYSETAGVVELVMRGKNVCILAYGQTGSGKTHTMDGTRSDPGVNVLALRQLFELVQKESQDLQLSVSILEIYNDTIQDLLESSSMYNRRRTESRQAVTRPRGLQIKNVNGHSDEVHVPGLTCVQTKNLEECRKLLNRARERRAVSSTKMNTSSSRSHLVMEVRIKRGEVTSRLNLVDLAGSERVSRSKVSGQGLQEAIHINKSLSSLANVFSALEKERSHIPYRDCKLTHFLRNSIGGGAKTLMFIMVSGDREDMKETFATLEFGKRVSGIVTNREMSDEKRMKLEHLQEELESADCEIRCLEKETNE